MSGKAVKGILEAQILYIWDDCKSSAYFSYPCNLHTEDTESIICWREFPLTEILRTVPTAEENIVPCPPCFSRLVVGNGG